MEALLAEGWLIAPPDAISSMARLDSTGLQSFEWKVDCGRWDRHLPANPPYTFEGILGPEPDLDDPFAPRNREYPGDRYPVCLGSVSATVAAAWDGHREADRVLERSGARIEHSGEDRAFYDLRSDRIVLPYRERFPEAAGYYQAALHELGHWTGHASRLNRATLQEGIAEGPYSKQYAREELRAEISSMMTGDRLDLGHDPAKALEPAVGREPVPELPTPAIRQPGGTEPGDQYRLFQAGREGGRRSGPGR